MNDPCLLAMPRKSMEACLQERVTQGLPSTIGGGRTGRKTRVAGRQLDLPRVQEERDGMPHLVVPGERIGIALGIVRGS